MSSAPTRWWGYHKKHRWVVLDRDWPGNAHGRDGVLTLVRCSDWGLFEESYDTWRKSSDYQYAPPYIDTRNTDRARKLARTRLLYLEQEYERRRDALLQQLVHLRHESFLRKARKEMLPAPPLRRATRAHRTANCWRCSRELDNTVDFECCRCGWIVCWNCGACGCGFGYSGYLRAFEKD